MGPRIVCEPPLGEVTVEESSDLTFHVSVAESGSESYEVAVWHDGNTSGSWEDLDLCHVGTSDATKHFRASFVPVSSPVQFTLKYRLRGGDWQWLNDREPRPNGEIILQNPHIPTRLQDFFEGWDSKWHVERKYTPEAASISWILTADAEAASNLQSAWTSLSLGAPIDVIRWFAIVRHSAPWLGPRHGNTVFDPDKEALMASFLRKDGLHLVLLAINGIPHLTTTIHGNDAGRVEITARNDDDKCSQASVVICAAKTIDSAIATAVGIAKQQLHAPEDLANVGDVCVGPEIERWYDAFTYCTWNGLGQQLSEEKLLGALDILQSCGLDFSNLVIDDNWQSLDFKGDSNFDYKWSEFEANKDGFPNGLGHTIHQIRATYPKIKHIAVWHGIFGYWGGMDPDGSIVKAYQSRKAVKQTGETYLPDDPITTVQGQEAGRMYDDFYAFLVASGVDSVKADNQFMPDYLANSADRKDTIYSYQDAWNTAVEKHFKHRGISCMSQTPQILFHSFLAPSNRPPYLVRNSDDFFPHEPASHAWHIFCNAHNALLTQHFNMLPDWDMFQTAGQCAALHAVARCLSGGPLYITDPPGEHDMELIESMTAKAVDGRSIVLRPETVATTMEAYVKPHGDRLLRLGTTHQRTLMLGLLNAGEKPVDELVKLAAFPKIEAEKDYIVRSHYKETINGPMGVHADVPVIKVSLDAQGVEVLSAAPVYESGGIKLAVLGLLKKISGPAAMRKIDFSISDDHHVVLTVTLKAIGILEIWMLDARSYLATDNVQADLEVQGKRASVITRNASTDVLHLDLTQALQSLGKMEDIDAVATLVVRVASVKR